MSHHLNESEQPATRADNLIYLREQSARAMKGPLYGDSWHKYGGSHSHKPNRHKNIDRTTIRKRKATP